MCSIYIMSSQKTVTAEKKSCLDTVGLAWLGQSAGSSNPAPPILLIMCSRKRSCHFFHTRVWLLTALHFTAARKCHVKEKIYRPDNIIICKTINNSSGLINNMSGQHKNSSIPYRNSSRRYTILSRRYTNSSGRYTNSFRICTNSFRRYIMSRRFTYSSRKCINFPDKLIYSPIR